MTDLSVNRNISWMLFDQVSVRTVLTETMDLSYTEKRLGVDYMVQELPVDFANEDSIQKWLENSHEKHYLELKKATSGLPNDFWPSYSSFANTEGGWVALGVVERVPHNELCGVNNADAIITNLWNLLSNPNKTNVRCIENTDVRTFIIDGHCIVLIYIHEASENMKPVYINGNMENTYIRTGDGDRKATQDELKAFLRNACPGQDGLAADRFTMNDLDRESVLAFKSRVSRRYPKQKYAEMTDEEFLTEIGGAFYGRDTGKWQIKKGTVLFLGKVNSIKDLFPQYHVDYFNRRGSNSRWIDRVTDDEPSEYEMNLYQFFTIVYEKMRSMLHEAFVLDSTQLRIPNSDFDETLRECIVNCLAHADYIQAYPSIKIEAYEGWFRFLNPGKMLVSKEQFMIGGDSRPRNEVIMKMFRLLGASERQGFGGPLIFKSAMVNRFRNPEIETNIEKTELKVWNIDLVDSYPNLSDIEKNILRVVMKSRVALSIKTIAEYCDESEYQIRKSVNSLVDENLLEKNGNGPSTKYCVVTSSGEQLTQLQLMLDSYRKYLIER